MNFPNSPTNGQTHAEGTTTYTYDATQGVWEAVETSLPAGATYIRKDIADTHDGTLIPSVNNTLNLGSPAFKYADVYATTFNGVATSAQYADLAENYLADEHIESGTVVSFGGEFEVTTAMSSMDKKIAGVISTNPAHLMNAECLGEYVVPVALQGRVPCKVTGTVRKGDMMVSAGNGTAKAEANPSVGMVIGKAIEDFDGATGVIEVLVGRI